MRVGGGLVCVCVCASEPEELPHQMCPSIILITLAAPEPEAARYFLSAHNLLEAFRKENPPTVSILVNGFGELESV